MKMIFILICILSANYLFAQQVQNEKYMNGKYVEIDENTGDTVLISFYSNNIPVGKWKVRTGDGEIIELDYDFDVNYKEALLSGYTELPPEEQAEDTAKRKWVRVEKLPSFPNGETALKEYIATELFYPLPATAKKVKGTVEAEFVVNKDGSVSDIQITRAVHPALDKEVVRIIRSMPAWSPALSRGEPVNVIYTLPVSLE